MSFAEHRKILADLKKWESKIPGAINSMGTIANNHYVRSFKDQGFTDTSWEPWKRRKNKDTRRGRGFSWMRHAGTDEAEGKRFKVKTVDVRSVKNRAILVKTGTLRRSIRVIKRNLSVLIVSNLPYAAVHNEGRRSGRGRGFKMPQRQFVGYSQVMNDKIVNMINIKFRSAFR